MPRKNRKEIIAGASVHHVVQRSVNHSELFRKADDYVYFKSLMMRFSERYEVKIYNYCLMPTHVHMLVMTEDHVRLSKFVQSLSLAYGAYFRRVYGYSGYLWQGRFKNFPIKTGPYMLESARYIERAPLRMLSQESGGHYGYPWSSFDFYARGSKDDMITANPAFERLGATPEERRVRYTEYIVAPRPYEEILDEIFNLQGSAHETKRI